MSTICIVCNQNWCGCNSGGVCSNCKQKMKEIERNPNLTLEQKQELIKSLNASNNQT